MKNESKFAKKQTKQSKRQGQCIQTKKPTWKTGTTNSASNLPRAVCLKYSKRILRPIKRIIIRYVPIELNCGVPNSACPTISATHFVTCSIYNSEKKKRGKKTYIHTYTHIHTHTHTHTHG